GLVDCYDLDAPFQKEFNSKSKTQDGFDEWAKEWILDVNTRDEYLEKVGKETIERITNPKFAENRLFE
ncbi:MAG: hypothetical protein M1587_08805, partial [Thaumarchaeota archaeon]|nr:hypothetical protein [Nitrososphaerota archaeon]